MLVEDAPGSRSKVRDASPHFPVFPEFQGASYVERYDLLCRKLVQEQLYTTASVLISPRSAVTDGAFRESQRHDQSQDFCHEPGRPRRGGSGAWITISLF